jgi:hypothetical protein
VAQMPYLRLYEDWGYIFTKGYGANNFYVVMVVFHGESDKRAASIEI